MRPASAIVFAPAGQQFAQKLARCPPDYTAFVRITLQERMSEVLRLLQSDVWG
jgi:hypothetical protein